MSKNEVRKLNVAKGNELDVPALNLSPSSIPPESERTVYSRVPDDLLDQVRELRKAEGIWQAYEEEAEEECTKAFAPPPELLNRALRRSRSERPSQTSPTRPPPSDAPEPMASVVTARPAAPVSMDDLEAAAAGQSSDSDAVIETRESVGAPPFAADDYSPDSGNGVARTSAPGDYSPEITAEAGELSSDEQLHVQPGESTSLDEPQAIEAPKPRSNALLIFALLFLIALVIAYARWA